MRFGYSGTSGSNDNYIGFGFHSADDLVKIYPNRINSDLLYPIGIVIETSNVNPSNWFGGYWGLIAVEGEKTIIINSQTYVTILYHGTSATVNINCSNYQLGNVVVTYNFESYGLTVVQKDFNQMLVPIEFRIWDSDHYGYATTGAWITKLSNYSFSIDTWHGDSRKNDYGATFTNYIENLTYAANAVGNKGLTKWRRMSELCINLFLLK
jgi:hypothetical protein